MLVRARPVDPSPKLGSTPTGPILRVGLSWNGAQHKFCVAGGAGWQFALVREHDPVGFPSYGIKLMVIEHNLSLAIDPNNLKGRSVGDRVTFRSTWTETVRDANVMRFPGNVERD